MQFAYYDGEAVNYVEFKLHMIATMMTCGLISLSTDQQKSNERIFIKGQVLLFVDEKNKDKVYDWLCNQVEEKEMNKAELDSYNDKWKHYPVWYYNKNKSIEDRWFVTNDIKALSEKTGNYIIVVEPNKYEEGVDLQKSNTLINFDIKLCPLKMEQRIGRIDRVKLVEEQPQLQIYSFAPLNDMSGFMVNFLANELKMFSCWKGDTTGIVSMPLGTKENSATFESAINQINEAYKGLYDFDADSFISGCKKVIDFGANFTNNYFDEINNLYQQGDEIRDDFRYLKMVTPYINEINFNSFENGAIIPFGEIQTVGQKMAIENGEQTQEQYSNHRNDPEKLKNAIESYYNEYINYLQNQISEIKAASKKKERGSIESANYGNIVQNRYERLTSRLEGIQEEFNVYKDSEVAKLRKNSLQIKQEFVVKITSKILGRYEERIRKYLDVLISLFDKFCKDVKQRSDNMAKFISYLTIEEFKAMVNSNE